MKKPTNQIIIKQIFFHTDMRYGKERLSEIINIKAKISFLTLKNLEVIVFFNNRLNIMKIISNDSITVKKLVGNRTYDFNTRGNEIFNDILKSLGVSMKCSRKCSNVISDYCFK